MKILEIKRFARSSDDCPFCFKHSTFLVVEDDDCGIWECLMDKVRKGKMVLNW